MTLREKYNIAPSVSEKKALAIIAKEQKKAKHQRENKMKYIVGYFHNPGYDEQGRESITHQHRVTLEKGEGKLPSASAAWAKFKDKLKDATTQDKKTRRKLTKKDLVIADETSYLFNSFNIMHPLQVNKAFGGKMTFKIKNPLVNAHQWFPDIPTPEPFKIVDGNLVNDEWDETTLEPGDWLVESQADGQVCAIDDESFKKYYEQVTIHPTS